MKPPHPDKPTKGLIIFDLCMFIVLFSIFIFYYELIDNGFTHEESLLYSGLLGVVLASLVAGFAINKYMRKHERADINNASINKNKI